jgi:hypothetical protein
MKIYIDKVQLESLKASAIESAYPDDEDLIIHLGTSILVIKHREYLSLEIRSRSDDDELIYCLQGCSYYLGGSRRKSPLEIAEEINAICGQRIGKY